MLSSIFRPLTEGEEAAKITFSALPGRGHPNNLRNAPDGLLSGAAMGDVRLP